ncbi:prolyl 4-hydroxylase subunit alpha-2-like isoform X1 [Limulus polyphemus]|uniref:procollagen-proline 4-dioxygenase n=1 Tax=Limulus polyphemus TaxID=6850 RepID=A0ABM1S883_LIMPO|nr:prolyl 4-hydroxylase subunit alpha-2-like isoform X1 [Limulus polyphemus]
MRKLFWVFLLISTEWCHYVDSNTTQIYASTSEVRLLLESERQLVWLLQRYVDKEEERLNVVKKYIDGFSQVSPGRQPTDLNPLQGYRLLQRIVHEWPRIERALKPKNKEITTKIRELRNHTYTPGQQDVEEAALAVVRLQDIYDLGSTQLAKGQIHLPSRNKEVKTPVLLTANDCLQLGRQSYYHGYFGFAVDWIREALEKCKENKHEKELRGKAYSWLKVAVEEHDKILLTKGSRGPSWQTFSKPFNSLLNHEMAGHVAGSEKFSPLLNTVLYGEAEREHYVKLCKGEKLRSSVMDAKVKCRLVTRNVGYFLLQPLKVEEQSFHPTIVTIYDFLSNEETNRFIDLAVPKLHRATHRGEDGLDKASVRRISKIAWINDEDEKEFISKISRRLELTTGLGADRNNYEAEAYQVSNYGLGGHYVTHFDFHLMTNSTRQISKLEEFIGQRIATFMIYLTDVEEGGATVFPSLGVAVRPKKGAAVFWWNLYKNGDPDLLTRHGGCPVLIGSKWVDYSGICRFLLVVMEILKSERHSVVPLGGSKASSEGL